VTKRAYVVLRPNPRMSGKVPWWPMDALKSVSEASGILKGTVHQHAYDPDRLHPYHIRSNIDSLP
jgi:hypothetical protein